MPLWLWLVSFAVVAWGGLVYRNGNRSVLMTVLFWAAVIGYVAIALILRHRMTGLEQENQRRTELPIWPSVAPEMDCPPPISPRTASRGSPT